MVTVVEVLVAHFNGSRFIAEQLESIQNNDLPENATLRITVIDDHSRLDEYEKLLTTSKRWPNVTVLRNEENLGVIRTFEKGLRISEAPFVMLCDQDDIWLPQKISLSLKAIRESASDRASLVFTELTTVDAKLELLNARMMNLTDFNQSSEKHPLLFQNFVTGCTIMINRALIDLALPFPKGIPMHDHWLALCAAYGGRMAYVDTPTMLYRQHSANLVGQPQRQLWARLKKPFQTLMQFRSGLRQKATQASALAARLPTGADQALVAQVAEAFARPGRNEFRFLVRSRVVVARGLSYFLIKLLFLTAPKE